MADKTDVRLVNTHAESIGRDDYAGFTALPGILDMRPDIASNSGMIALGTDALLLQEGGEIFRIFPA